MTSLVISFLGLRRLFLTASPFFYLILLAAVLSVNLAAAAPSTAAITSTPTADLRQPELASGWQARSGWHYSKQAVAAANPLAAQAGQAILAAGGNALDAAIATQLVLALVEPQSSGLGGGAFLLSWHKNKLVAWDGRETAPATATPDMFLDAQGQPVPFMQVVTQGRSVGVPGLLKMLEAAHQHQGKLAWHRLFQPAIQLAEEGFAVSPRLHQLLTQDSALKNNPAARKFYYSPNGAALPVGYQLKNPAFAAILRQVAKRGTQAFYTGPIADSVVAAVNNAASIDKKEQQQIMQLEDLAAYQPVAREALCSEWQNYRICGFPPPSSGQIALVQILNILDAIPADKTAIASPESFYSPLGLHQYFAAANLAFADRAKYVADPAFVSAPAGDWSSLLDASYLRHRASLIGTAFTGPAQPGQPRNFNSAYGLQPEQPEYGTTHISVIDAAGNGLALTSSIEQAFGARILVDGGTGLAGGFFLNNQLTDFAWQPYDAEGKPVANKIAPGKRPRSSMSPTLVFSAHADKLVASLGSPGGAAIIHFTAKTLLGSLAWQLSPQAAIELPNIASFNSATSLVEQDKITANTQQQLQGLGYAPRATNLTSGIQMLLVTPQGILGGADPRREGWVAGE